MKTPLLLIDNLFDRVNLYHLATLSSTGAAVGSDVQYVADYRRERSSWRAATSAADRVIQVDMGAGATAAPDAIWLDRGHNLWGATVVVEGSSDGVTWNAEPLSRGVPALTTVGGDPETSFCVTEEGAIYALFVNASLRRYWRIRIPQAMQPVVPGVILGKRAQLARYSRKLDEDAGGRMAKSQESDAGYLATDRVYAYRKLELQLATIGAAEYDATVRVLRRQLFEINQPAFIVMNYGSKPERGWLYQLDDREWSFSAERVNRSGSVRLREVGPLIR